jgi:hypothetical protein
LAWSFIFGIFASTAFSLVVVPLVYFLINERRPAIVNEGCRDRVLAIRPLGLLLVCVWLSPSVPV